MRTTASPQWNLLALAARIQPQDGALASARGHRMSVRARLTKSFAVASAQTMGSHARQTAVHRFSDLDFMVVLRKDEFFWGDRMVSSDTVLNRLLADLKERFPLSTVRRDILAASLGFGSSGQSLDIVPAKFHEFADGRPVYLIPDGEGAWLRTSPATHDRLFETEQERSGNKLRRISQLLKWWKHARETPLPIRSFYIDMLLCSNGGGGTVGKTYGACLKDFFEHLVATECRPILDPCGIAGRIAANDTHAQHETLNRAAAYAHQHAHAAIAAEQRRDFAEANRQWSLVFNGAY
jgi:hypothetical protein